MKIGIRVDSSIEIGSGHVMRCITLAEKLRKKGHIIYFICRESKTDMRSIIQKHKFYLISLSSIEDSLWDWVSVNWEQDVKDTVKAIRVFSIDFLIVDHYSIDYRWENIAKKYVNKLMVIDDLANRKHNCDVLLDYNFYKNYQTRYNNLINEDTLLLLGPKYMLLRNEFFQSVSENLETEQILITFGGSDPTRETLKVVNIIKNLPYNFRIVVGELNPDKHLIYDTIKEKKNFAYLYAINNMAEEILKSKFVIGAGGISALERVVLRTPSLLIKVADNQSEIIENIVEKKAAIYIGSFKENYKKNLLNNIHMLMENKDRLNELKQSTKNIISIFEDPIENIIKRIDAMC